VLQAPRLGPGLAPRPLRRARVPLTRRTAILGGVCGAFYDEGELFERYRSAVRPGPWSAHLVMEEPALLEALGDVRGLRVLDVGCGDAAIGRTLLDSGCRGYLGIDASARMVDTARDALAGTGGAVRQDSIERFASPPESFDVVISRMALHYVADLDAALAACRDWLAPGGRIVFSVVHPVVTCHDPEQPRGSWVVDDYFDEGPRELEWLGERVVWHHRTVERYVGSLQGAGFRLTALSECEPRPERFGDEHDELDRMSRIPLILLLAGDRS
jgi:SAM-dependent methyltransferase